jgi:hypothetical protein
MAADPRVNETCPIGRLDCLTLYPQPSAVSQCYSCLPISILETLWNSLPDDLCKVHELECFKCQLKTVQSYGYLEGSLVLYLYTYP